MKVHDLKIDYDEFISVLDEHKTNVVRENSGKYNVDDYLVLEQARYTEQEERDGKPIIYTGNYILAKITHIHSEVGKKNGWCVLSIKILDIGSDRK